MDIQKARQIHALRGIRPPEIIRLPPMYGTPFGQYPQIEDVTFRGDEPQTWAQGAGLDPPHTALPYVNPVIDQMVKDAEARYGDANWQLDQGPTGPEGPMGPEIPMGPMGLYQSSRERDNISGGGGSDTLAGGTKSSDRRAQFVSTYLPYAQEAARLTGVDPAVVLAVAAHETGWGRKAPGNNFFGIKGRGQTFATHEYVNGKRVNVRAGFRSYADPRDSFLDWARLMHKPNYAGVLAATTPEDQIKALKAAGYATDPLYVRKLSNVREQVADLGGAIQVLPEAIAGLQDAVGGTQTPNLPAGTEAYAPALLAALDATPAQAAIDDAFGQPGDLTADQIDELTRTDVAGNYTNPLVAPPPAPFVPASGPIAPNFGPWRSPADVLAAGPRPRPAALSPVRPPMPNTTDRNLGLLPPMPGLRPGGAPDAGMPPSAPPGGVDAFSPPAGPSDLVPFLPPPRVTAAPAIAPPDDDRIAAIQSIIDQGVTDPNEIWGNLNMDRDGNLVGDITQAEIQAVLDRGQRNAPDAQSAIADAFGPGTPFSQVPSSAPSDPRTVASDLTPARLDRMRQSRGIGPYPPRPDYPAPNMPSEPAYSDTSRMLDLVPASHYMPSPRPNITPDFDFAAGPGPTFTPPSRPNITPDFDFAAGPGPTFTPPSLTPDIRGRPEFPGSMPLAPPPLANAADDPYRVPSSFDASRPLNGRGGSDVLAAGNASPLPLPVTTMPMPSYPARAGDTVLNKEGEPIFDIGSVSNNGKTILMRVSPTNISPLSDEDLAFGLSKGWQLERQAPLPQGREGDAYAKAYGGPRPDLPPTVPAVTASWAAGMDQYRPMLPLPSVPGTTFLLPGADPNNITLPTEPTIKPPVQVAAEPVLDPAAAAANQPHLPPIATSPASVTARDPQAAQTQSRNTRGRYAEARPGFGTGFGRRILQSFIPGGSFLGPNAVFGLGNAGSFTPSGAFGTSPFNQQLNGSMGSTNWRQGSVTGNPSMQGVMWNRSGNNGSVGYVTSPFTGDVPIYSGSPNRF